MLEALKVLKKYDMKMKGLCNKIEEGGEEKGGRWNSK
jgi:hypothetical protein